MLRALQAAGLALISALLAPEAQSAEPPPPLMVVDLHVDVPWQVYGNNRAPTLREGQARVDALRAGGYGGVTFPIYISDKTPGGPTIDDAEKIYKTVTTIIASSPVFLPLDARFAEEGRISSFLAIEGAGAFAADITAMDRFIERGVRFVGLAHARNNKLASAATDVKPGYGLTDLGKQLVTRIYAKGALIDVSHLSDEGFADLVPIAEAHGAPIVATHSNARAICNAPRNLTDDQLRAIGRTGGVAGLNFHAPFVVTGAKGPKEAKLADVVKQFEHMVAMAGIDHVAIGSDFDGDIDPAEGLEDASRLPVLAAELRRRGRTDEELRKVFSLNALRVLSWRGKCSVVDGKARCAPAKQ
ncbi:dipeptidase [Polyangium aurulentum]|uniref:dipeptidase n=1 Tax=Polyangium aurulentum TaxID=2567896 RepID=UPI0010AEE4B1|nr:dipeptidase [Polyangium aurulentum]UQA63487.1 dipeptidase [Polyangium aurulentum]